MDPKYLERMSDVEKQYNQLTKPRMNFITWAKSHYIFLAQDEVDFLEECYEDK
jgi:hypothetical protein